MKYSLKKEQLFDIRDLKFHNLMLNVNVKTFLRLGNSLNIIKNLAST